MSVTTWTRIEPDILTGDRQADLAEGIAARLADPLWLIGRQWQMGELQGEDAGSPIAAHIAASSYGIDHIALGTAAAPYAPASTAGEGVGEHDGTPAGLGSAAGGGRGALA